MRTVGFLVRSVAAVAFAALAVSCAHSGTSRQTTPAAATDASRAGSRRLDHIMPARDSVGRAPKTFTWTAVQGADSYSIGVWNEVDVMIWRQNNIPTTSVDWPDDMTLEPGTYFWSVSALSNGEEVADSGLSAFVVRTSP
jgi:hypothetical protein